MGCNSLCSHHHFVGTTNVLAIGLLEYGDFALERSLSAKTICCVMLVVHTIKQPHPNMCYSLNLCIPFSSCCILASECFCVLSIVNFNNSHIFCAIFTTEGIKVRKFEGRYCYYNVLSFYITVFLTS